MLKIGKNIGKRVLRDIFETPIVSRKPQVSPFPIISLSSVKKIADD